jgi:hypothetical protein
VSAGQILDICRASEALGVAVEIWGTFWDAGERVQDLLPEIERWATVQNGLVSRSGRAARSGKRARHARPEAEKYSCGGAGHYLVSIFPDGEVFPCCSGDFNRSAGLSCGNIRRDAPAAILRAAYGDFHVRTAKDLGWGVLYAVVERHFPALAPRLPRFADADSPCEICRTLNRDLKQALAPVYAMIETEFALTEAEFEWARLDRSEGPRPRRLGAACARGELRERFAGDAALRRAYLAGDAAIEPA